MIRVGDKVASGISIYDASRGPAARPSCRCRR